MVKVNTLYGWDVSPYTSKVETYFNYKNIPFNKKAPSAYTLANKIKKSAGKQIMPVVFDAQGGVQQDSTLIIDHYEALHPEKPVMPSTAKHSLISRLVEFYADDWLPMAALHYRWNYKENNPFIMGEFGRSALPYFPSFIQTMVAKKAAGLMSGYLPILGITDKTQAALERNTENLMANLDKHFAQYAFLLGGHPTLADFSLYGPLYAHLHRDPFPVNLVAKYENLLAWINIMGDENIKAQGELIADDQIPETLLPILKSMGQYHIPLLEASVEGLNQWAQDHVKGDRVPGKFGHTQINIEGTLESRLNLSFPYWKLQRMNDLYQGFDFESRAQAEALFDTVPEFMLIKQPLKHRVRLNRCSLYLEESVSI
jgi:glutathione S-transferase